jgi:hypothetical protein
MPATGPKLYQIIEHILVLDRYMSPERIRRSFARSQREPREARTLLQRIAERIGFTYALLLLTKLLTAPG